MRKPAATKEAGLDQKLIQVLGHPVRIHALAILNQREASPKELAAELDFELTKLSYHIRLLERFGYIKLVGLVNGSGRRGGLEHRYVSVKEAVFSDEEWVQIPEQMRGEIVAEQLGAAGKLVSEAMAAGTFERRPDRHHSLVVGTVDEQGWTDAMLTLEEAMLRLQEIQRESADRLGDDDEGGGVRIPLATSMLGFERAA